MGDNPASREKIIALYEFLGNGNLVAIEAHASTKTVYRILRQAGLIQPRKLKEKVLVDGIEYTRDCYGYYRATRREHRKDTVKMRLHRLIANKKTPVHGKDVHHENQIKGDDREENLTVMDRSQHVHHHKVKQDGHIFS